MPKQPLELTAKEARKQYLTHLKSSSWCIDSSAWPIKGFQATSNRNCAVESFGYGFPKWARSNNVKVAQAEYEGFRKSLKDKIIEGLPMVLGSSFRPTLERTFSSRGALLANTYLPFTPTAPADMTVPDVLTEYLDRVLPLEQDQRNVLQFLAHIIQQPESRPKHALLITGEPASGKSSLLDIMKAALNNNYVWHENNYGAAFKAFSEVFPNNLIACFDDATATKNTYETLKHSITKDWQEVELKGVQQTVSREVYARIIIISNKHCPLNLDSGARREYVTEYCTHKVDAEESKLFFAKFYQWMALPDTPAFLHHWLKNYPLDGFLIGSTTQTAAHARMLGLSVGDLDASLASYVETDAGTAPKVFTRQALLSHLEGKGIRHPDADDLKQKMGDLGYSLSTDRKIEGLNGGKKVDIWQPIPKAGRRAPNLTQQQIETLIADHPGF